MRMFEIHEIEDRITEVLHQVRETGETVSATEGGEIIAHLVPARTAPWLARMRGDPVWTDLDTARAEMGSPLVLKTPVPWIMHKMSGPTWIVFQPRLLLSGLKM